MLFFHIIQNSLIQSKKKPFLSVFQGPRTHDFLKHDLKKSDLMKKKTFLEKVQFTQVNSRPTVNHSQIFRPITVH